MTNPGTSRHHLPILAVGQAQKEITHNEALILVDALLHPVAEGRVSTPPVLAVGDAGKCWIVGSSPAGEWAGKTGQIAIWIGGSWRYLMPCEGMRIRVLETEDENIWLQQDWRQPPQISDPDGGATIDQQARQAIITLLQHFRMIGLVTS